MLPPGDFLSSVVASAHETCPGGSAGGALAIGILEERSSLGQLIDVRGLGNLVAVAPEGIGLEIVGNDQQYVFNFRVNRKAQENPEEKNRFPDHELR